MSTASASPHVEVSLYRRALSAAKSPVIDHTASGECHFAASLDIFRIDDKGSLTFVRKYDVDVGNASMFWSGLFQCASEVN